MIRQIVQKNYSMNNLFTVEKRGSQLKKQEFVTHKTQSLSILKIFNNTQNF